MLRIRPCLLAVIAIAMSATSPVASADIVDLKDGRSFEGIIVLDSPAKVIIETMVGKFKVKMTFRRNEILSTERKELPEGFFETGGNKRKASEPDPKPETKKPRAERRQSAPTTRYVEIPIKGTIGIEVQADGVERALNSAIKRGVRHAVFVIDSPGGYVAEAEAITEVIENKRDDIRCYAVVESAISAAIWVTIACDRVFMHRDGEIGGAVVYSKDQTTGAAEVDAKMNSIIAAKLAARAQRAGINGDAIRAMIIPEAEYFAWKDEQGGTRHAVRKPEDLPAERLIIADGEATVLTLTGEQALAVGLAREYPGDLDALGGLVDAEGWKSAGNIGTAAMAAAHRAFERNRSKQGDLIEDINTAFEELAEMQQRAIDSSPGNFRYTYDPETNLLVAASQIAWRKNTDNCMSNWRALLRQTERIERMLQRAEKLGLQRNVEHKDLKEYFEACQKALFELEKNRNRYYVNR